jgi:hypothetical protein
MPFPTIAEGTTFKLIDTGWLSDSKRGEGIAMVFQADNLLEGGLAAFDDFGWRLCNDFAAAVAPFVLEKTGKTNPVFFVVTIRHGNSFVGTYWKEFYQYVDGTCGDPLKA